MMKFTQFVRKVTICCRFHHSEASRLARLIFGGIPPLRHRFLFSVQRPSHSKMQCLYPWSGRLYMAAMTIYTSTETMQYSEFVVET